MFFPLQVFDLSMDEIVILHAADKCLPVSDDTKGNIFAAGVCLKSKIAVFLYVNQAEGALGRKRIPGGDCFH